MSDGYLLKNLLLFGRILHELGLDVSPGRMVDVVNALAVVDVGRPTDFYYTLRSLCVHKREQIPLFDVAFDHFWRKEERGVELNLRDNLTNVQKPKPIVVPPALDPESEVFGNDADDEKDEEEQPVIEVTRTFSANEQLRTKDFGEMSAAELHDVKRLMAQLIWQLGQRRTRRLQPGRGDYLDMRRTVRANMRNSGELLSLSWRRPKIKPRPLIILADISGSMEQYTRLLLHFLYSLTEGLDQRVEVFVFSTRLTRITRQLRNRNVDAALAEVATAVPDWSGGTRIGDALRKFNYTWARRVLRGGAVGIIISDGWDRGEPALLSTEMARLNRLLHRFVWLNPLLGSQEYEPLTRGMVAALPHVDDFLPVHNLASLEDLAVHLALLDSGQARRKRQGAAFVGRPR